MQRGGQRTVEGAVAQQDGLHVVGHAQTGRHVGLICELDEDALAGRVNRADPAALDERDQIDPALAAQPGADALPQLAGGTPGEGDGEHLRRQVIALGDGAHVALDEHRRLARAGTRIHEDATVRLDGGELRWRQRRAGGDVAHARTRQMPPYSQYFSQKPASEGS